ncbi:hypothetical protein JZO67_001498 [Enterococcus sp. 665A]|uniref:Mga helix-turn-helix domain-containing protein n=2 Tax=Candidatus Enterococcus ferrettii TaxID=2815324 RepID=A0ABV0ELQ2_9ENTE
MFCLEKKTMKQIRIIETLDELTEPITAAELAKKIDYGTPPTVLGLVKEIKDIVEKNYNYEELDLLINHKGILLIRNSGNLNKLYDQLLALDLGYEIIKCLILDKKLNTHNFCVAFGVSESTLKRKLKLLNHVVKTYNFHITCSNKIGIKGSELNFRIFSFIFLTSIHPQFKEINWVKKKSEYIELAKEIVDYLTGHFFYKQLNESQVQTLALWLYLTNLSEVKNKELVFSSEQVSIIRNIQIIDKPECLSQWSVSNWQFLLIGSYCFQLSDFPVREDLFGAMCLSNKYQLFGQSWIHIFQKNFTHLTQNERIHLKNQLLRIYVADIFMRVDQKVFPTLNYNNIFQLKERYPCYSMRFENFFGELSNQYPKLQIADFKVKFLRICLSLYPLEKAIATIKVFYFSGQYNNFDTTAKENLKIYFSNQYHLLFTANSKDADVIISTVDRETFTEEQLKRTILIRSPFLKKDLLNIDQALKKRQTVLLKGGSNR